MKLRNSIGTILIISILLSGCARSNTADTPASQSTADVLSDVQGAQTLEAQSANITPPPPPPNLSASGEGLFLPYQTCFDLDTGQQTGIDDPACDFTVEADPSGAGQQMGFLPVAPAAFDINLVYQTEPLFEQCRDSASMSSTVGLVNLTDFFVCYQTAEGRTGVIMFRDMDAANGITFDWKTYDNAPDAGLTEAQPLTDSAEFVADVTVPDDTVMSASETFIKTWRLRNNGSSTWTLDYKLVFSHGDDLLSPAQTDMPIQVPPGETVDIFVELTAPDQPGEYVSHWMLMNASGDLFGVEADQTLYTKIIVE
jgi:Ig-like domain from next to BRCA1 gene